MSVRKVNFEPVSNVLHIQRRDFPLLLPALADPTSANPLVDGEWCSVDAAGKLIRAADIAQSAGTAAAAPSYPCWNEKGRYDNQAMGERKKTVIYLGPWEFDTLIFNPASLALNSLVAAAVVDIDGKKYSGLVANGTLASPGTGITVGLVTRLPAANGGKLRIRGGVFF